MLDKYINIKNKQITCGQTTQGFWYCKEVIADNSSEMKIFIGEINGILNEYNIKKETGKK